MLDNLVFVAGHLLSVVVGTLVIAAMFYWQYYEWRVTWQHSKTAFIAIKALVPIAAGVFMGIGIAIASGTSGMEGLGVFYLAIIATIVLAPLSGGWVARLFQVPFADAMRITSSLVALVVVCWFAGHSVAGGLNAMLTTDYEKRDEYQSFKKAASNASPAGDLIRLEETRQLRMPDGQRLIYAFFHIDESLQFHQELAVAMQRSWSRDDMFRSTIGGCFSETGYHLTNIIDEGESVTVRLRWHAGSPESMVEHMSVISFPAVEPYEYFQAFLHNGELSLPVPLPAARVQVEKEGGIVEGKVLYASSELGHEGRKPNARCLPISMYVGEVERLHFRGYSEEHYQHVDYSFVPWDVAPAFR